MRWKEFSFWLLFLLLCFGAGYLHGNLPDFRLQFAFSEPEKVRIVVFEKALFSPAIIHLLEEKTHTQIQIDEVSTWQEARLKTVLNPGAHLLFLPSYWIPPLVREGRLRTITSMKSLLDSEIAPELRRTNEEKIYEVPLFWTLFEFAFPEIYKNENLEKLLEGTKISSIYIYSDPEMNQLRSHQEPWNYPKIKVKIKPTLTLANKFKTLSNNEVAEISLHAKKELKSVFYQAIDNKKPLEIFSLTVPNNSPQRTTSLALIKALISDADFDSVYAELPAGSGLKRMDLKLAERLKKASYLKEISFKELYLPEMNQ